jgi:hypothetical protein
MEDPEDNTDVIKHPGEDSHLRLVPAAKRESLRPDSELKTLIEKMKGKEKRRRVRLSFDDDPDAA